MCWLVGETVFTKEKQNIKKVITKMCCKCVRHSRFLSTEAQMRKSMGHTCDQHVVPLTFAGLVH